MENIIYSLSLSGETEEAKKKGNKGVAYYLIFNISLSKFSLLAYWC